MSADRTEPLAKRTRLLSRRAARKTESAAQTKTVVSKRNSRRNVSGDSTKDEIKLSKEIASTSSKNHEKIAKENSLNFVKQSKNKRTHGSHSLFPICAGSELYEGRECYSSSSVPPLSHERIVASSHNIVHYLSSVTRASLRPKNSSQLLGGPLIRSWSYLVPDFIYSHFVRRVTVLACHPTIPHLVVAGSKGGELALLNLKNYADIKFVDGIGAGGSVVALKFHPQKPTSVYTASISGKVRCQDLCGAEDLILLDSLTWQNWFCSLDVLPEKKLLMAGDSLGWMYMVSDSGESLLHKKRMHKSKVTHAEFCQKLPHLIVTSSTDHTVKLWDLRMISSDPRSVPLHTLMHNKGINSAYFNPSNSSLLTTDQHSEVRVYSSPWWDSEVTIHHPHRQFQHLTPIKASWHPFLDAVVVGRYPDEYFCQPDRRTVDFFDGHSGKELYRLESKTVTGIKSLNCFNCIGDTLVSGSGHHVIFWRNEKDSCLPNPPNVTSGPNQIDCQNTVEVVQEQTRHKKISKSKKPK